jgi:hypothetical protein
LSGLLRIYDIINTLICLTTEKSFKFICHLQCKSKHYQ